MNNSSPNLASYTAGTFQRGRANVIFALWVFLDALFVSSWIPGSPHRRILLRLFGAQIGYGVVIKPRVQVKFPWRLKVGENAWIGEGVWIDNLAEVMIGSNVCISQGAYLCTGSHDWTSPTFDLIVKPITLKDGSWIAAKSTVGPGVTIEEGAVLGLGSTTSKDLEPWSIYSGSPAVFLKKRSLNPPEPL